MNLKIKYLILLIIIPFNLFANKAEDLLLMIENGSVDKAVSIIDNNDFSKKEKAFLCYRAGEYYFLNNSFKKALNAFDKAKIDFDEKELINWNIGLTYFALKDYDLALNYFDAFLISNLSEEKAMVIIKSAFFSKNYQKTLNLIKEKDFIQNKREITYIEIKSLVFVKEYKKSLNIITSLLKSSPFDIELLNEKIRIKKIQKKDVKEEIYLLALIKKDRDLKLKVLETINSPQLKSIYLEDKCLLAKELFLAGLYNRSLFLLKKSKCKKNSENLVLMADINFYNGSYLESANLYLEAAKLNKDRHKFYFLAGKSFFMGESFKRSKKYLKMASKGRREFSIKSKKLLSYLE